MVYARWTSTGPLASFVESFAVQESPPVPSGGSNAATRVLPVGRADLVLAYGDPFARETPGGDVPAPLLALVGQRTRPLPMRATGATGLVLVTLRPWATGCFGPCTELTDALVDLSDLLGRTRVEGLVEDVRAASGPRARARSVEAFLRAHLPRVAPDPCVVAAVERLQAASGRLGVRDLAASTGASRRHLLRLFQRHVGLAPKTLARILRFQATMAGRGAGESWSRVAATGGYTDQAHLTRECRRLAGVTPGTFERLVRRSPLQAYFNVGGAGRSRTVLYL